MPEGTPQNQPAGATPAPGSPAPEQEFEIFELSPKSKFKLAKGEKVPDPIVKALKAREDYIQRLEDENKGLKSQGDLTTKLQQALGESGGKPETKLPDPVEDPQGYHDAVVRSAEQRAELRTAKRQRVFTDTAVEVDSLSQLVNTLVPQLTEEQKADAQAITNRQEKIKEYYIQALDHAKKLGLLEDTDFVDEDNKKMPHFKAGAARMVFRDLFHDQLVASAKSAGLEQTQELLGQAASAPLSIPGSASGSAGLDYAKLRAKDPAAAARMREEASKRTDSQKTR